MTSSNGNIFRVTGPLCGEFTGPGEFPAQRPVTQSFDVFFDLRLDKRLSKQPWGWWFKTPAWSLWRHRNDTHDGFTIHETVCWQYDDAGCSWYQLFTHSCRLGCVNCEDTRVQWYGAFSALLGGCEINPPVTDWFPSQRTSNAEVWYFFDLPE